MSPMWSGSRKQESSDDPGAGEAEPELLETGANCERPEESDDGTASPSDALGSADEPEIARLNETIRDLSDQLLRSRADLENVRRRGRQEREEAIQFGNQEILRDLLPIVDNFERALSAGSATVESLRQGVELTLRQMESLLRKHGVETIPSAGEPFDPLVHEAVSREDPSEEHPAGTVVDELQRGYRLRGRLLRPSMVRVAQAD